MRIHIKLTNSPTLGKNGSSPAWIQIPNLVGDYSGLLRFLSVSSHATLEIKQENGEKSLLVFFLGRYMTITKTEDASKKKVWILEYNDNDVKQSEHPEADPNEEFR